MVLPVGSFALSSYCNCLHSSFGASSDRSFTMIVRGALCKLWHRDRASWTGIYFLALSSYCNYIHSLFWASSASTYKQRRDIVRKLNRHLPSCVIIILQLPSLFIWSFFRSIIYYDCPRRSLQVVASRPRTISCSHFYLYTTPRHCAKVAHALVSFASFLCVLHTCPADGYFKDCQEKFCLIVASSLVWEGNDLLWSSISSRT